MKRIKKIACPAIPLFIGVIFCLSACEKFTNLNKTSKDNKLSFTYNGINYVLPRKEGVIDWGVIYGGGIFINRPDIFNGVIYFRPGHCAFLAPGAYAQNIIPTGDCILTLNGAAIDSVAVYLYKSGDYYFNYKNCQTINGYDLTGTPYTEERCDGDVNFNLTLKNKDNKTIALSDGKIVFYFMIK